MNKRPLFHWRRALAPAAFALVAIAFSPHAAQAIHTTTPCNSDTGKINEVYVEWHSIVFAGVDTGISDSGRAVCAVVLTTEHSFLVGVLAAQPGSPGLALRLRHCTPNAIGTDVCTETVSQTGVEANAGTPLASCVWVNGVQRNPGCS